MNYQYNLIHYGEDHETTIKTNDPRLLLDTLQGIVNMGDRVDVIDGFTGEVLCAQNCENPIMQEAFGLMVLGRLMERAGWAHEE